MAAKIKDALVCHLCKKHIDPDVVGEDIVFYRSIFGYMSWAYTCESCYKSKSKEKEELIK